MFESITLFSLTLIAGCSIYLLRSSRFEEGIFGHLALAVTTALCVIALYVRLILHEPMYCPPLISCLLAALALFFIWYCLRLWLAGERRKHDRFNQRSIDWRRLT